MKKIIVVLAVTALAALHAAQASVIGRWTFNEGSGSTALDSSGNGNNGVISGGAAYVASPGGFSLQFDGVDDSVSMGAPALFNINGVGAKFSLAYWGRVAVNSDFNAFSGEPGIGKPSFAYGMTWYNGEHVWGYVTSPGNVNSKDSDGGGPGAHAELFTAGAYHHVVLTYDQAATGTNLYLYIDNVAADFRLTSAIIPDNSTDPFLVGLRNTTFFKGLIDQVELYNTALSAAEIADLFSAGPVPEPSTVVLLGLGGMLLLRRRTQRR